jgi:hypothetical protein
MFNHLRCVFAVLCLQVAAFLLWSFSTEKAHLAKVDTENDALWRETFTVHRATISESLASAVAKATIESNLENDRQSSVSKHESVTSSNDNSTTPLLRVFVYENLPFEFTTDIEDFVKKQNYFSRAKKDNFGADIPIINLFRQYSGRTDDPTQADLFVVPYPHRSHCLSKLTGPTHKGKLNCPQVPEVTIDHLFASLSYLNSTTRAKHLFVLSGDTRTSNRRLEQMPLTLTLGPVPEVNHGNIVIPYLNSRPDYQPTVIHERDENWWTRPREYAFAYFFGKSPGVMNFRPARGLFDQEVNRTYGTSVGGLPFRMKGMIKWSPANEEEAFDTYQKSVFCPCVAGDGPPQKRFFDAMMSGCLPVVVSAEISRYPGRKSWFRENHASVEASYPFAKGMFHGGMEIDYESFVVQARNISDIKRAMEAILADPDDLRRRQRNLRMYAPLVSYDFDANAPRENAFTQILKAIHHYLHLPPDSNDSPMPEMGISRNALPDGPKTQPHPELTQRLLGNFIVVPEHNLLFCYVEKVGCSMFNHLFRMLRLHHPNVAEDPAEVAHLANFTWWRNTPKHFNLSKHDLENILVNPNWTKAVFYRDPRMRFLSAFRDKCENTRVGRSPYCERFASLGPDSSNFDSVLDQIQSGNRKLLKNPHFAFASDFCGGLGSTLVYYDFVHELNSDTALHVETLLNKIGVPNNIKRSLVDNTVRSKATNVKADRERAAKLGVELGLGPSQLNSHNTDASKATCDYFSTRNKVKVIEELYSVDFETFGLNRNRDLNCTNNNTIL